MKRGIPIRAFLVVPGSLTPLKTTQKMVQPHHTDCHPFQKTAFCVHIHIFLALVVDFLGSTLTPPQRRRRRRPSCYSSILTFLKMMMRRRLHLRFRLGSYSVVGMEYNMIIISWDKALHDIFSVLLQCMVIIYKLGGSSGF